MVFFWVVVGGYEDCVWYFLSVKSVRLDSKDVDGRILFFWVVGMGCLEVVKMLFVWCDWKGLGEDSYNGWSKKGVLVINEVVVDINLCDNKL